MKSFYVALLKFAGERVIFHLKKVDELWAKEAVALLEKLLPLLQ